GLPKRAPSHRRRDRHHAAGGGRRSRRGADDARRWRERQRRSVPAHVPVSGAAAFGWSALEAQSESAGAVMMRRFLSPSLAAPVAIVAALAAIVVTANIREGRRSARPFTKAPALGAPGAPATSRAGLEQRIA